MRDGGFGSRGRGMVSVRFCDEVLVRFWPGLEEVLGVRFGMVGLGWLA